MSLKNCRCLNRASKIMEKQEESLFMSLFMWVYSFMYVWIGYYSCPFQVIFSSETSLDQNAEI